jgi:hypothetical protein
MRGQAYPSSAPFFKQLLMFPLQLVEQPPAVIQLLALLT